MKSTSFFFMGLGAGVALGMLYSPKTGEANRDHLRRKTQEGTDYISRTASESADYLKRQSDDLKKSAADVIERGKTVVTGSVRDVKSAVETGKQAYGDAVSRSTGEAEA